MYKSLYGVKKNKSHRMQLTNQSNKTSNLGARAFKCRYRYRYSLSCRYRYRYIQLADRFESALEISVTIISRTTGSCKLSQIL